MIACTLIFWKKVYMYHALDVWRFDEVVSKFGGYYKDFLYKCDSDLLTMYKNNYIIWVTGNKYKFTEKFVEEIMNGNSTK